MKHFSMKKKIFNSLPGLIVLLALLITPALALAYDDVTLDDAYDFTYVVPYGDIGEKIEGFHVIGLNNDGSTGPIYDPGNIWWTVSDDSVVKFVDEYDNLYNRVDDIATVDIKLLGVGASYVIAHYYISPTVTYTVHSYIVVEDTSGSSSVANIDVYVDGPGGDDWYEFGVTVNRNVLDYLDPSNNQPDDDKILQMNPSALHALAAGGNAHFSNPDWAEDELTLTLEGSYLVCIEDVCATSTQGWKYTVLDYPYYNDLEPDYAASAFGDPNSSDGELDQYYTVYFYYDY